jgi:hypothetical protein
MRSTEYQFGGFRSTIYPWIKFTTGIFFDQAYENHQQY